ncbi:50S ribosomal protein L9 [Candidatus Contubernalis alkaliaceticus]|uniref:50S ribosomal protein L9 n=1 Tax=Candidatus Contubernalis alkaliaceticus TaxID=338645 RepID=UPI001F4C4597|nr:50S ribosomal protein L9 [Candidatus Contubernalis alkalaceticus]UNC93710.1 50S ribosomal protein L9 [Candidatus Contubernalis alkalaceticus]
MKVILLKGVKKLGEAGDVKDVSQGYARNYLIPNGMAVEATPSALKDLEKQKNILERKEKNLMEKMEAMAEKLKGLQLTLSAKVGEGGKLFGSVTSKDIAEKLQEQGFNIDRRKIDLKDPIRGLGAYNLNLKLHPEVSVEIEVIVEEG